MLEYFNDIYGQLMDAPGWIFTGLALLVCFPIVTVIVGEVANRLWKAGHLSLASSFYFLRNAALPLLFAGLMVRTASGLHHDHMAVKLLDTLVGIAGINVIVSFFNAIVFAEGGVASNRGIPKLFLDLLRLFLVALGAAFVISSVWNVNLGAMLTALGVGSVVLGLALQDTLGSLFTGLAMLSARNFKVGDWVKVGDQEGIVVSMNWRTMVLKARSGDDIVLPNLLTAKQQVRKFMTEDKWHIISLPFELSYDHPPEQVKKFLVEAALETPGVLHDPFPQPRMLDYADHGVEYEIRLFVDDYVQVPQIKSDYKSLFWYVAKRNKLIFPGRYHKFYKPPSKLVPPVYEDVEALTELLVETKAIPRKSEILQGLLAQASHHTFREQEFILEQGEIADYFYIITSGRASVDYRIEHEEESAKSVHIQTYETGQFVVFKTLFSDGPTPFAVRAEADFEAIGIPVDDFERFLIGDPQLAHEIQEIISTREESAERILRDAISDYEDTGIASDRVQILKQMFPN